MTLSAATILQLATQCAPNVAPQTVAAIVASESQGDPYAVNVNAAPRVGHSATAARAAAVARRYFAAGYSVDLGLGQINSGNMHRLGLTWQTVFDPCKNLAALGRVLTKNYEAALTGRGSQTALRVALSLYNTGSTSRGFYNGYVRRVVANAGKFHQRILAAPASAVAIDDWQSSIAAQNAVFAEREIRPPAWKVFASATCAGDAAHRPTTIENKSVWSD